MQLFLSLRQLIKAHKHEEALEQTKHVRPEQGFEAEFYYLRSLSQLHLQQYDEALKTLNKALSFSPTDPDLISQKGVLHFHLQDLEAALKAMNSAQNLDPKNAYRYSSRAFILERKGETQAAIDDYKVAIELDPEDAVAYNNLGLLEEKLGWEKKALEHFRKADELSAEDFDKRLDREISPSKTEGPKKEETSSGNSEPDKAPMPAISDYLKEMKQAVVSKAGRKEFWNFLKGTFSSKK